MVETDTDFSQSNMASPAIGQECVFSGEETVGLISRRLDFKVDKKFADFKGALEQKFLQTRVPLVGRRSKSMNLMNWPTIRRTRRNCDLPKEGRSPRFACVNSLEVLVRPANFSKTVMNT